MFADVLKQTARLREQFMQPGLKFGFNSVQFHDKFSLLQDHLRVQIPCPQTFDRKTAATCEQELCQKDSGDFMKFFK